MIDKRPRELKHAEHLMYKGKFEEALDLIMYFEKDTDSSAKNLLSALILKGRVFIYVDRYKEAVETSDLAFKLSQKQESISESIDVLLLRAYIIYFGQLEEAIKLISKAEDLMNSLSSEKLIDYNRQQLDFMIIHSIIYRFKGDLNKAMELAHKWKHFQKKIREKLDISRIFLQLGDVYIYKGEPNIALEYAITSLEIQQELKNQTGIAKSLALISLCYYIKGDFNQALNYCKQCLKIKIMSSWTKIDVLNNLGLIYREKGELCRTLRYYKQAIALAESEQYIEHLISLKLGIISVYRMKGEIEMAIDYAETSEKISRNYNHRYGISTSFFCLILTHLDKNSLDKATHYLPKLKILADKSDDLVYLLTYQIAKALVLRKSKRIRDRTESETLLKQIVENEITPPRLNLISLVNLCDLYLEELYLTNNFEVLEEIKPLINKMLEIAEKTNAKLWLTETKLLQAKLSLIQLNFTEAKLLLTQAQRIAEIHGFNLLAIKISNEHDALLEQLNIWENLKNENAPMSERIRLASIEGVLDRLKGKQVVKDSTITPETPVLLLIIGKGGLPVFSHSFRKEISTANELLSGFLSAFSNFGGEIFSKGLDRAKFGDYIIHIQSADPFSVCYLFKGPTFGAKIKLTHFNEAIQGETSIWEALNQFFQSGRVANLNTIPLLEDLIKNTFT